MGRIRTAMIKRNSNNILDKNPEAFSKDFDKNKEALDKVADIKSKKLRNVIAGYITKLKKLNSDNN